jgi:hypothetical protein
LCVEGKSIPFYGKILNSRNESANSRGKIAAIALKRGFSYPVVKNMRIKV